MPVKFCNEICALTFLRCTVLLRQKMGWMALVLGLALVPLSFVLAQVSFVKPEKIFWDFALGVSFVIQVFLATYLSTHLLEVETKRKTLHLLLSRGVSRLSWLCGNGVGLSVGIFLMNMTWLVSALLISRFMFGVWADWIVVQSQLLVGVEISLLVFLGFFMSMFLRPALAWLSVLALSFLLHSVTALQLIFEEMPKTYEQSFSFYEYIFKVLYLLPPLEWLDIRSLVGYEDLFPWASFMTSTFVGLAWVSFFLVASWLSFQKRDI